MPLTCIRYIAVRREGSLEYYDWENIGILPFEARDKARQKDAENGYGWAEAFPIVRIAKVKVQEVPG